MRVMVIVKATQDSERGLSPEPWASEMMAAMSRYNDELRAAGVFIMADGLQPTSVGKRIAFDGASRTLIDGPFTPPSAQLAGFWLWEVRDMDEAITWAKRCPNPMPGPSEIEIRLFYE